MKTDERTRKLKAKLDIQDLSAQKVIREQWAGVPEVIERIEAALDAGWTADEIESMSDELFPGYVQTGENLKGLAIFLDNRRKFVNGEL